MRIYFSFLRTLVIFFLHLSYNHQNTNKNIDINMKKIEVPLEDLLISLASYKHFVPFNFFTVNILDYIFNKTIKLIGSPSHTSGTQMIAHNHSELLYYHYNHSLCFSMTSISIILSYFLCHCSCHIVSKHNSFYFLASNKHIMELAPEINLLLSSPNICCLACH